MAAFAQFVLGTSLNIVCLSISQFRLKPLTSIVANSAREMFLFGLNKPSGYPTTTSLIANLSISQAAQCLSETSGNIQPPVGAAAPVIF